MTGRRPSALPLYDQTGCPDVESHDLHYQPNFGIVGSQPTEMTDRSEVLCAAILPHRILDSL